MLPRPGARGQGLAGSGERGPGTPLSCSPAGSSWAWPGAVLLGFGAGPGALIPGAQHAQKASAPVAQRQGTANAGPCWGSGLRGEQPWTEPLWLGGGYFLFNVQKRWMVVPTLLSPFLYKSLLANTHGKLNCSTVNAGAGKLIISGRALALELLWDPRCRGVRASVGSWGLPAVGLSDSQSSADPFPEPSPSLCTRLRALGHHSPIPVWTHTSSRGLVAVTREGEAPLHGAWSRRPRALLGEPPGTKGSAGGKTCRSHIESALWSGSWTAV